MRLEKAIGYLLISAGLGIFIPYTILTLTFNYPQILRERTETILTSFHEGGIPLILTWLAFALFGILFLAAYSFLGQRLEQKKPGMKWVTTIGIASVFMQMIGLLRWVFVVPFLANEFVSSSSPAHREAVILSFKVIHQFAGVLMGEHLGQLFTVIWTVFVSLDFFEIEDH